MLLKARSGVCMRLLLGSRHGGDGRQGSRIQRASRQSLAGVPDWLAGARRRCRRLLSTQASPCLAEPVWALVICPGFTYQGASPRRGPPQSESNKASFMSFKEPDFADRQKAAMQARQNILNKFRAQPGPDDPEVKRRQAEREAHSATRAKAKEARDAARAEEKTREAAAAAEAAALLAREKEEKVARLAALEADQKAKRDARYAARKGKGKKK
jgi:hypothetical protein